MKSILLNTKSSHNISKSLKTESSETSIRAFLPEKNLYKNKYKKYEKVRQHIVNDIKERIEQILAPLNSNAVVSGRIKNFESFFFKHIKLLKAGDNNPKITDLLGIRIICPFIEDISAAEQLINENFQVEEKEKKGHATFKEFGYESTHILIKIPYDIIKKRGDAGTDIVEIQIRTILQDAWAEVEHELVYKAEFSPFDEPMKRKLAAVNASLSLADIIFQEIRSYQRKFTKEMGKRRESFFHKIEESTDNLLFSEEQSKKISLHDTGDVNNNFVYNENSSIDDLLIGALSAHNQNRFNDAINQYSKILELKPNKTISSIIYKHRGMANFACSCYDEAIDDFNNAFALDNKSYKAAYYRGVVHSVLKIYSSAIDDYTLSLSINPYQSFCLFRRAQAYYHIGDYPQALSDCENSLALEPQNKSAVKFRDLLHEKLKM
jgi:putative GTP pyrophosphokinase